MIMTAVTNATFSQFGAGYDEIEAGERRVRVTPTGDAANPVIDENLTLTKDEHYTLFAVNNDQNVFSLLRFQDNLSEPSAGKGHIRIAHLIPDASNVKLSFQGTGQGATIPDAAFLEKTENFTSVDAGEVTLRIQEVDGKQPILPDLPFTLEERYIYTVALTGTLDDGDSIDAQIVMVKHEESHD